MGALLVEHSSMLTAKIMSNHSTYILPISTQLILLFVVPDFPKFHLNQYFVILNFHCFRFFQRFIDMNIFLLQE